MNKKMIEIAALTLKISEEEATKHCQEIPDSDAAYFWENKRGGISVIVGEDGSKLGATSAVSYDKHLAAFKSGRRN